MEEIKSLIETMISEKEKAFNTIERRVEKRSKEISLFKNCLDCQRWPQISNQQGQQ